MAARRGFGALLGSRFFVPLALAVMGVSILGSAGSLLVLTGHWPPTLPTSRGSIVITGPDATVPATMHATVLGAVYSPGRYALPEGSHVRELIVAAGGGRRAAGGAQADADLSTLTLSAVLADGQAVYVVRVGEIPPTVVGGKINLNTASADDLRNALGLSATIAKRIVSYRQRNGAYTTVSQLLLVPVSQTTYDKIKDVVTV